MTTNSAELNCQSYTVEQTAVLLGVSRASAYAAVKNCEIPCIRIGRRVVIPRPALDRLLAGRGPGPRARTPARERA